ncbi:MAG: YebC/PmpR family DNA-binding transcriptional regulator [Candidatus Schekmanbacteria bacterium]|nr:YebC/PmpR family DNA-binding transcriptional regulator [Candidatus Schekmanbacteria bacterium]
MSGHSKWSTIKRKKEKIDAKRGKIFTRIGRDLTISAREAGGDVETNARLRAAVLAAKAANMPSDNIDRAIKRGTGELPGVNYEEAQYEGYGPGGVAIMIEVLTDNLNRSVAEIRHAFTKCGGSLGEPGCVSWNFDKRGVLAIEGEDIDEDELFMAALEAGAEDVRDEEGTYVAYTLPERMQAIKESLEKSGYVFGSAEVAQVPKSLVPLTGKEAERCLRLVDMLEELDSVQYVFANFDIPQEVIDSFVG